MTKKIVFSGVQPSGDLTIGNYIGAIKNWVKLQNSDEYDCVYSVVDLHAITVPQLPADLRSHTLETLAVFLACGIDPEKSTIFIQSHVKEHIELAWILNSMTYMGELNRQTQFKEKAQRSEENLNAALFTYPVLMASDILLYDTDVVPVGEDQKQHLELTRDLANRFNNRYSPTFTVPEPLIGEKGARIMSLQDPKKKMSKSDENENGFILILDDEKTTEKKIMRAVTDSEGIVAYNDSQDGLKNLINIYSVFSELSPNEIVKKYKDKGYGDFKRDLANLVNDELRPVREKYEKLISDKDELERIYKDGAEKASYRARRVLSKVKRKVGFIR